MAMLRPWLTLVGDVHSNIADYMRLVERSAYSIQLGDLGFDYSLLQQLDPARHRFLPGNHDNYEALPPHAMGDFGLWRIPGAEPGNLSGEVFFVRGAFSIDRSSRTENVDWFAQEQLSEEQFAQALELYAKVRPDFVISHDGPTSVVACLADYRPTARTNQGLQAMLDIHRPKRWFFAHHHFMWGKEIGGTLFMCVGELAALDMDERLSLAADPRGGRAPPIL
ncbi:MAG: metallophosphoesterase [Thermoguttaceae bacterium]|jgi:hypothetical protein|nr:metallophosphoesterase [Thermoguttaceae bacterium]